MGSKSEETTYEGVLRNYHLLPKLFEQLTTYYFN